LENIPNMPPNSSLQRVDNPLTRDIDDLPDDVDDEGDDQVDRDFLCLLVSTFKDNEAGSGEIIVVPNCDDEDFSLIASLDKPVGMCFDEQHRVLFVCGPTFGTKATATSSQSTGTPMAPNLDKQHRLFPNQLRMKLVLVISGNLKPSSSLILC
jgi:hypothetical protein